jgi:putative oxygen-independent coproporphyrinogen III oxidase
VSRSRLPPLSLYVHLPWCVSKCPYCDFNSHKAGDSPPRRQYVEALLRDLKAEAGRAGGRKVETIFLGGGTPSLFAPGEIQQILRGAQAELDVADAAEITMEANPGTVECGALAEYRAAGVNRLSIGAQSFDASSLLQLGRIHGPDEILRTLTEARAAGFDSINLDLMYGLPGQTLAMAQKDLGTAVDLEPEHISFYQLTLEPNTVFHSRPPTDMPDDDAVFEIQEASHAHLQDAGYQRYEISAFARPGLECRHNLNYWLFGDYLAVGAGGHGKITDKAGKIWRYQKPAHPMSYIGAATTSPEDTKLRELDADDIVFEYMLNALRLPAGFTVSGFEERTGLEIAGIRDKLEKCRDTGTLVCDDGQCWRPTELGLRFGNDLQAQFLPSRGAA